MPKTTKNKKSTNKKIQGIIDPLVRNYGNDPFFVKKANEMKALIDKVGLPKEFYDNK